MGFIIPWKIMIMYRPGQYFLLLFLLIPVLSCAFCTCTHGRSRFFSRVALLSALGSVAGLFVGGAVALPFVATGIQAVVDIIISFFLFIFPFFTCRHFCAGERLRERNGLTPRPSS
jgi:hypothetical protein